MLNRILSPLTLLLVLIVNQNINAQTPNRIFGEVNIQDTQAKKEGTYSIQQDQALQYTKQVSELLAQKNTKDPPQAPSEGALFYLSGLFLYCSAKTGACPFILDTIIAGEFLSTQTQTKKSCPNMKHFWELWKNNGFEERLPYLVPIGSNAAMKNFIDRNRNAYIKCEDTVANFVIDPQSTKNSRLTVRLIEQVKEKKLNIFQETGAFKPIETEIKP